MNMKKTPRTLLTVFIVSLLALTGCDSATKASPSKALTAQLNGSSEVPPVATSASGVLTANLVPESRLLTWTLSFDPLTGPVMGAHFHGPAGLGENAPVVVPMTGSLTSPITGSVTLTPGQMTDLTAGKWYVNLHTSANQNGEIRGQISDR